MPPPGVHLPASLDDARIQSLPHAVFYIPNFLSVDEETAILNKIQTAPLPRWTQLSRRRLQTYPSTLTAGNVLLDAPLPSWLIDPVVYRLLNLPVSPNSAEPQKGGGEGGIRHIFSDSPHARPNHVLINEYLAGQGIMPHEDGAAYHPVVCTVSLGAAIVLDVYKKREAGESVEVEKARPSARILQEPRSLLITTGEMYTEHLHGIEEVSVDESLREGTIANWGMLGDAEAYKEGRYEREMRTSLTYRDVLKVSKLGNTLKFLGKR